MPFVKVPVLSKIIVSISFNFSIVSDDFVAIPIFDKFPIEITIHTGTASPSEQGHATTNTDINAFTEFEN